MTESEAITLLKGVCSNNGLKAAEVTRAAATAIAGNIRGYTARMAILTKEGGISEAMIRDVLLLGINSGGEIEFVQTGKDMDDLKTDIMIVTVEIEIGGQ